MSAVLPQVRYLSDRDFLKVKDPRSWVKARGEEELAGGGLRLTGGPVSNAETAAGGTTTSVRGEGRPWRVFSLEEGR